MNKIKSIKTYKFQVSFNLYYQDNFSNNY